MNYFVELLMKKIIFCIIKILKKLLFWSPHLYNVSWISLIPKFLVLCVKIVIGSLPLSDDGVLGFNGHLGLHFVEYRRDLISPLWLDLQLHQFLHFQDKTNHVYKHKSKARRMWQSIQKHNSKEEYELVMGGGDVLELVQAKSQR